MALGRTLPLLTCLSAILFGNSVFADKALPNVPEPEPRELREPPIIRSSELVVKRDARGATRIIIPAKLVAGAKVRPSRRDTSFLSPTRNVIAGLALSAAIAGVFLIVRRGGGKTKTTAMVLIAVSVTAGVSITFADLLPPPDKERPQILVQIDEDADVVTLIQGKDFPAAEFRRGGGFGEGAAPE